MTTHSTSVRKLAYGYKTLDSGAARGLIEEEEEEEEERERE